MSTIKKVSLIFGIIILIGVAYSSISGFFVKPEESNTVMDKFAKCISLKGATMYGAEWCGHCKQQKELFGNSFKYVSYVECPQNQNLCDQMGIEGYPTWVINGQKYPGLHSIDDLKQLTGCSLES